MSELTAARTLVKSAPELWAQCSDPESLGRHLHAFGEITITRLEPEQTVAWEGERARGTVRIEPSGWGTKVTLTAIDHGPPQPAPAAAVVVPEAGSPPAEAAAPAPAAKAPTPPAPAAEAAALPEGRGSRLGGLFGWLRGGRRPLPDPVMIEPPREPVAAPAPPAATIDATAALDAPAALDAALDSLGQAHHRPFSRS